MFKKSLFMLAAVAMIGLVSCKPKADDAGTNYSGEIKAPEAFSVPVNGSDNLAVTVEIDGTAVTEANSGTTFYIIATELSGDNADKFTVVGAEQTKATYDIEGVMSVSSITLAHSGAKDDKTTLKLTLWKLEINTDPQAILDGNLYTTTQMSGTVEVALTASDVPAGPVYAATATPTTITITSADDFATAATGTSQIALTKDATAVTTGLTYEVKSGATSDITATVDATGKVTATAAAAGNTDIVVSVKVDGTEVKTVTIPVTAS